MPVRCTAPRGLPSLRRISSSALAQTSRVVTLVAPSPTLGVHRPRGPSCQCLSTWTSQGLWSTDGSVVSTSMISVARHRSCPRGPPGTSVRTLRSASDLRAVNAAGRLTPRLDSTDLAVRTGRSKARSTTWFAVPPAETSIAVVERVDRLELVMHQRGLYERRQHGLLVDEPLQVRHQRPELIWGRRHESRSLDGCPRRTDPVLCSPQLTGLSRSAADPVEDRRVHLLDEPQTHQEARATA